MQNGVVRGGGGAECRSESVMPKVLTSLSDRGRCGRNNNNNTNNNGSMRAARRSAAHELIVSRERASERVGFILRR